MKMLAPKKEVAVLIFIAILSSCKTYAASTQATITPITVNTLSTFYPPTPSSTPPANINS
jgi:hypothetical protein